jgi:RimJ/RimL family protein N-acetyltransferase
VRIYKCLLNQNIALGDYEIRVIQDEDIQAIRCWRNAQVDVLRQASLIQPAEQISYYENYIWPLMLEDQPCNILFSFFDKGIMIGYGGLVHISWHDLRAEVSFIMSPGRASNQEAYGQDFTAFLSLIANVAFKDLKLHRLFTETYDIRPHHIEVLEANGFVREGILRDHIRIAGKPVNSIFHGILNEY